MTLYPIRCPVNGPKPLASKLREARLIQQTLEEKFMSIEAMLGEARELLGRLAILLRPAE
jgi:hypothetical protein